MPFDLQIGYKLASFALEGVGLDAGFRTSQFASISLNALPFQGDPADLRPAPSAPLVEAI